MNYRGSFDRVCKVVAQFPKPVIILVAAFLAPLLEKSVAAEGGLRDPSSTVEVSEISSSPGIFTVLVSLSRAPPQQTIVVVRAIENPSAPRKTDNLEFFAHYAAGLARLPILRIMQDGTQENASSTTILPIEGCPTFSSQLFKVRKGTNNTLLLAIAQSDAPLNEIIVGRTARYRFRFFRLAYQHEDSSATPDWTFREDPSDSVDLDVLCRKIGPVVSLRDVENIFRK